MRKRSSKSVVEDLERSTVPRQNTEVRSGWKNTSELERVALCRSLDHRRRTQLDFSSGESFDDPHRPTTLGAKPKIVRTGGGDRLLGLPCRPQQLEAKRQGGGTVVVRPEAENADAHETFGEQMQQEAAQELIDRQRQQLLFVVVGGIAPTKRNLAVGKRDQAVVGDGYAMSVTAQITEHMLWASEGTF